MCDQRGATTPDPGPRGPKERARAHPERRDPYGLLRGRVDSLNGMVEYALSGELDLCRGSSPSPCGSGPGDAGRPAAESCGSGLSRLDGHPGAVLVHADLAEEGRRLVLLNVTGSPYRALELTGLLGELNREQPPSRQGREGRAGGGRSASCEDRARQRLLPSARRCGRGGPDERDGGRREGVCCERSWDDRCGAPRRGAAAQPLIEGPPLSRGRPARRRRPSGLLKGLPGSADSPPVTAATAAVW